MAISRMQRATFLVPRDVAEDLPVFLQGLGMVHVEDFAVRLPEDELERLREPADAARSHLKQIDLVESVFTEFAPASQGFFAGLVNAPLRVSRDEVRRAVHEFDLTSVSVACRRSADAYHRLQRQVEGVEVEIAALQFFARLPFRLADLRSLRCARVWIVRLTDARWQALQDDEWAAEHLAFEVMSRGRGSVNACVVAVADEADEAASALKRHEAVVRPLPELDGSAGDRLTELRAEASELRAQAHEQVAHIVELSEGRRQVAL